MLRSRFPGALGASGGLYCVAPAANIESREDASTVAQRGPFPKTKIVELPSRGTKPANSPFGRARARARFSARALLADGHDDGTHLTRPIHPRPCRCEGRAVPFRHLHAGHRRPHEARTDASACREPLDLYSAACVGHQPHERRLRLMIFGFLACPSDHTLKRETGGCRNANRARPACACA